MMRAWIAVALLAGSWLFGLDYYHPAAWTSWLLIVLLASVLLGGLLGRMPPRREMAAALAMLLPVVWFLPWPYRAAPLLVAAGLAVELSPLLPRWPRWLSRGALVAGMVLLAQSVALWAYTVHTARTHELPWPAPLMIGQMAALSGADVAVDGSNVALHIRGQVHRLGATWELFLDPATLGFFAGGAVILALAAWANAGPGSRWPRWVRSMRTLALLVAAWLPVRVAVLMALYLHRVLRTEQVPPTVMDQFFSPWVLLLALAGPVALAIHFIRWPENAGPDAAQEEPAPPAPRSLWRLAAALGLVSLGVGLATAALERDPAGRPAAGRVMFVERHSLWEPTTKPYDTTRYGELASYNYGAIYEYCSQYFDVSQLLESDPIDDATLAQCDVLVIKIPTARYVPKEVEAIGRFVAAGGGLLLVGDHTNVFRSSTYLNDVARQFGFTFRNDLLFRSGSPYEQLYRRPLVPHPVVQRLPPMNFAVSCSIDPGTSSGQAVIRSTGLWSLPSAYHSSNYHPFAEYRPRMRYGAFIQVWATRHRSGRVLAFTDSTIFSNFCTFQPGKAELMLGMLQWLNHRNLLAGRFLPMCLTALELLLALVVGAAGLWIARPSRPGWIALVAAGLLGWTLGSLAVVAAQRWQVPPPELLRPMTRVVIDRTTSEVPLADGAFNESETGFGMLEQWISRLDCYTVRQSGPAAFSGDALVVICPTRSVSHDFRQALVDYVADGGKLLVVDSPEYADSTANSLLWPFGLAVNHANSGKPGKLTMVGGGPAIALNAACEVTGGEPFARLGTMPVAATTRHGKGMAMAVGFGSLLNDTQMGESWMEEPTPDILARYNLLYAILRTLLADGPDREPGQDPSPDPPPAQAAQDAVPK